MQAQQKTWDCLVIGAGPAGSFAARELAQRGKTVLLVDAKHFPRDKVCGGCLNRRGQELLASAGLLDWMHERTSPRLIDRLRLVCRHHEVTWSLPAAVWAIRRADLDEALVEAAVAAGASFLSGVAARVLNSPESSAIRNVQLRPASSADSEIVEARVVLCADGLQHSSLADHAEFSSIIDPRSRIGLQTTFPAHAIPDDTAPLSMIIGQEGYVGMARMQSGDVQVAAALDPDRMSTFNRPSVPVESIFLQSGVPIPEGLHESHWTGTPALSRRSQHVSGTRLFLIGDAIGYVEPFTGEGMASALSSARAVIPFVQAAIEQWQPSIEQKWESIAVEDFYRQQRLCRRVSTIVHYPRLAKFAMQVCDRWPSLRYRLLLSQAGRTVSSE